MLEIDIFENSELSLIEIINIGKEHCVDIQKHGWYEVIFDKGTLTKVTKHFNNSDEIKDYLLTRVDEFTDYIIKKDLNLEEILPFEYKLYKIRDYYNQSEQIYESLVQLLKDFGDNAELFDIVEDLRKPLNAIYEMIKKEELKNKKQK